MGQPSGAFHYTRVILHVVLMGRPAIHLPGAEGFEKLMWLLASKFYTQFLKVGDPLKSGHLIGRKLHPLNAICSLSLTTVILYCFFNLPHFQLNLVIHSEF